VGRQRIKKGGKYEPTYNASTIDLSPVAD